MIGHKESPPSALALWGHKDVPVACSRRRDAPDLAGYSERSSMEQRMTDADNDARRDGRRNSLVDRTGQRYGKLVVVEYAGSRLLYGKKRACWLCRCDCGNEVAHLAKRLVQGGARSCGCAGDGQRKSPSPPGRGDRIRNVVHRNYRWSARTRGLCWELTDDDFDRLTTQPCFYCGLPPSLVKAMKGHPSFTYTGIDRMDNNLGYAPENVVPCCTTCNMIKGAMPYADFMAWIARLTEYQFFHPEVMPSRLLREARKSA